MKNKLVSIITLTYSSSKYIEDNIKSINENFELFFKILAILIHNGKGTHREFINFINDFKKNFYKKSGIHILIEPEVIGQNIN